MPRIATNMHPKNPPRPNVALDVQSGRWLIVVTLDLAEIFLDLDTRTAAIDGTTYSLLEVFDVALGEDLILDLEIGGHLRRRVFGPVVSITPH